MVNDKERARIDALNQADRNIEARTQLVRIRMAIGSGTFDRETADDALDILDVMVPKPVPVESKADANKIAADKNKPGTPFTPVPKPVASEQPQA